MKKRVNIIENLSSLSSSTASSTIHFGFHRIYSIDAIFEINGFPDLLMCACSFILLILCHSTNMASLPQYDFLRTSRCTNQMLAISRKHLDIRVQHPFIRKSPNQIYFHVLSFSKKGAKFFIQKRAFTNGASSLRTVMANLCY